MLIEGRVIGLIDVQKNRLLLAIFLNKRDHPLNNAFVTEPDVQFYHAAGIEGIAILTHAHNGFSTLSFWKLLFAPLRRPFRSRHPAKLGSWDLVVFGVSCWCNLYAMTTEISVDGPGMTVEKNSKENRSSNTNSSAVTGDGHTNGLANGFAEKHSSKEHRSDKDKQREKDKHREKSKDKDREERSKDKDRHSLSGKDKDKPRSSSSSKDKDRKHRDEKKDREHKSSSSKDKEHKSSSSSKDKDRHSTSVSKDKEKHSNSSSHREKEKSSSSSGKDKHVSSSSSSKEKSKHSSSSDKRSSSSGDKHKSKEKDKSKSKDEERHKERKDKTARPEVKVKTEVKVKEEPEEMEMNAKSVPAKEDVSRIKVEEDESDEDVPLAQRSMTVKREVVEEDSDDDVPLMARKKVKKEPAKKRKVMSDDDESDEDMKPRPKKVKTAVKKEVAKPTATATGSPKKKKKEEEVEVWKWWEEKKRDDGVKWKFLEHLGPMFADAYVALPPEVKFAYNGKEMRLSPAAEEVATFYAKMLEHDYTTKEVFNKNFFKDWRKTMNEKELEKITDLSKCNFKHINAYFLKQTEIKKAMTKEEKKVIKEKNEAIQNEYGFCTIDGHKEKIGNFRIEPPGLFRGRGDHPKMGMHKKRVMPEQVIINCSGDSKTPKPPPGHKWKEVRHDNSVTWLASWTENVQGQVKYVMLNPSSKLKGEKDWQKYEVARELKKYIGKIRDTYQNDWKAKEMMVRQRAVALYFIDKLALRAGNEKDDDQADTVGCCSLRVEHISLQEELGDKKHVVVFDFLGKDSIRYYNEVAVEKRVFKNLQLFMQNKSTGDDLFDRLNTGIMNKHLGELMPGLSAKVFRTYNASITLQDQLDKLTEEDMTVQEKILAYNRANRAVAILCNHQRAVPKTHEKSMGNMKDKIAAKEEAVAEAEKAYKNAKREKGGSARNNIECEKKKKTLDRLKEQLDKLNLLATDKEENKDIALGTSKLNYLDPRISVAWCKKFDVPLEKVYNKTQRSKFNWAIDMATPEFVF